MRVEGVSKKFCKDLKRSLWYGIQDIASDLLGLKKNQELRKDEFWAVNDVSFELRRGECLGLIGHNGAGKSTLLKMLNGLINPDKGKITMKGRIGALIELGAGFNPILTGRENVFNNGAVLGFSQKEIAAKYKDIVEFAELEEFMDTPVQNYSSGMKVRLGFAVAAQMEPDVLIIDEVLAVGDLGFKIKCFNRIQELLSLSAVIFVSHSMPFISRICSSAIMMKNGKQELFTNEVSNVVLLYMNNFDSGNKKIIGDKQTKVNAIELHDFNGEITNVFQHGSSIHVKLSLSIAHGINEVNLKVIIFNIEQRSVMEYSMDSESKIPIKQYEKLNLLSVFSNVSFNPGKYTISVVISSKLNVLYRVDNLKQFIIKANYVSWAENYQYVEWITNK